MNNIGFSVNNSISYRYPAFCGQRIFVLPIKTRRFGIFSEWIKGGYKQEQCYFTELGQEDVSLIEKVAPKYRKTDFGGEIVDAFLKKYKNKETDIAGKTENIDARHFYMLEAKHKFLAKNKVRGLVEVKEDGETFALEHLQSSHPYTFLTGIKGIGTAMLYGVVRIAQKLGKKKISWASTDTAQDWYSRKVTSRVDRDTFYVAAKNYDKFLKTEEEVMEIERPEFLFPIKK